MHLGRISVAVISTVVASGAYYAYRGTPLNGANGETSYFSFDHMNFWSDSKARAVAPSQGSDSQDRSRRALVIDRGQIFTEELAANERLHKDTDDYGRKVLEMMTPEQATERIRKNEASWHVGRGNGVIRYDVVQLPSNDPIEDDHAEKIIELPTDYSGQADGTSAGDWMFWGVFDGHRGWITSAKLRQSLISYVARELNKTYRPAPNENTFTLPSAEMIDNAIKTGFLQLDYHIVHASVEKVLKMQSKRVAAEILAPALSGSCALLSFYDSQTKLLRVACTGDSRAVLGRRSAKGKWVSKPLSIDQTGQNEDEVARLRKEHPGEEHVVANGRVLGGLEPSRAFGDASYKWPVKTQELVKNSYFGRSYHKMLKTPPYVTAEPIITTTRIEPQNGDFVVMATDGLWEMLTNDEVVGLVGQWIEENSLKSSDGKKSGSSWPLDWFKARKGLPVEKEVSGSSHGEHSGQREPIRQRQWGFKGSLDERFVVEDKNAATHLVRNALGGKDTEQISALLTLPSPHSRRYRDDLTVEVIFFGEGENSGTVSLNKEASTTADEPKPRL